MSGNDGACTHMQYEQVQAGITWGFVGDLGKAWWMEWPIDISEGLWGVGRRQRAAAVKKKKTSCTQSSRVSKVQ